MGNMTDLSLANGTENGEHRLRFYENSSDIRLRLSDVRYTWGDDDCSNLAPWRYGYPGFVDDRMLIRCVPSSVGGGIGSRPESRNLGISKSQQDWPCVLQAFLVCLKEMPAHHFTYLGP